MEIRRRRCLGSPQHEIPTAGLGMYRTLFIEKCRCRIERPGGHRLPLDKQLQENHPVPVASRTSPPRCSRRSPEEKPGATDRKNRVSLQGGAPPEALPELYPVSGDQDILKGSSPARSGGESGECLHTGLSRASGLEREDFTRVTNLAVCTAANSDDGCQRDGSGTGESKRDPLKKSPSRLFAARW